MIYAKNGILISKNDQKKFQLYDGKVMNKEKLKVNVFEFEQIDFNLSEFSTNTILVPKIQETPSYDLIKCAKALIDNPESDTRYKFFNCKKPINETINQELLKRFYKPFYLPVIAIICCFLIIFPKDNLRYIKNRKIIFLASFFVLILSETSLRYASKSTFSIMIFFGVPWLLFILSYFIYYNKVKNV